MNTLELIGTLKQNKAAAAAAEAARLVAADRAYLALLGGVEKALRGVDLNPADTEPILQALEADRQRLSGDLGVDLRPQIIEPQPDASGGRRDGLGVIEGGFTVASFRNRIRHLMGLISKRLAPATASEPTPAPRRMVQEVKALPTETLPERVADAVEIKLPARKAGKETAAMAKLRAAQQKHGG